MTAPVRARVSGDFICVCGGRRLRRSAISLEREPNRSPIRSAAPHFHIANSARKIELITQSLSLSVPKYRPESLVNRLKTGEQSLSSVPVRCS
jgi:hypothetical protein